MLGELTKNPSLKQEILVSQQFKSLNRLAQSYLFCSFNSMVSLLSALIYIEQENNITLNYQSLPPDIVFLQNPLVADINKLTLNASLAPIELKNKYYIIANAHSISDSVANKLLKTLEEPPPSLKIFVLCNSQNNVKPTIRSRCQILTLDNLQSKDNIDNLDNLDNLDGAFEVATNILLFLRSSSQICAHIGKLTTSKEQLSLIVKAMELLIHDVKLYLCKANIRLLKFRSDIVKISQNYTLDTLIRLDKHILLAKKRLQTAGNLNSIADQLLFGLLKTKHKHNLKGDI